MHDSRRRVVHVTGSLDMGGQEKLLVEFARHADRDRFDLRFVSLTTHGPLAADLEAEGWPVTALDVPPGLWPGLVLRLARIFRQWRADAVHTHNDRPLIYAAPAARLARVGRVVHTRHGRGLGNSRRQVLLGNAAARLTDDFVCVSEDAARMSVAQGLPPRRVQTVWNGIDTRRFAFADPRPDGPAVIVARLSPEKDIATLLHAVRRVVDADPAFRLEIAGDGPCLPELRRLAAELGLDGSVTFLGLVRDVPALLARAKLYVLSSISEGVSLTLLEAMACGLPVVATRVGGTPEVVVDETTGLLVPPGDPAALAAALNRTYRDADLAAALGRRGRARVEAHFDIRRMVAAYERKYLGTEETSHDAVDNNPAGVADGRRGRAGVVAAAAGR
jgi:glycosyltransferase involved in cell wall biosynthesis